MAKKKKSKGLLFWLVTIVAGIFIIGFLLRVTGVLGDHTQELLVDTEKAKIKTITQLVSSSGKIQPEVEVIIRPDVSGEIIELAVNEGDYVRKGDLLLRIKPDIYQARIDELNAMLLTQKSRLEQAKATLIQAETSYTKNKELYDRDVISEMDYVQSKSNYESQKANLKASEYQVESAKAQLRRAEEELQQTVIRAPQNGTITGLEVELGERVLGNAQMAGTDMMRISVLDKMEVLVEVNENDIVQVAVQDTAKIEIDAYPERIFEGVVTEIANSAKITGAGSNEQITNYQVKVRIITPHNIDRSGASLVEESIVEVEAENFIPDFKPGMSASVDIETKTVYSVVSVPIQAVTVRDFSKDRKTSTDTNEEVDSLVIQKEDFRKVVFVYKEGKAVRQEVKTGISDNSHIQILHGIDKGEEVVTGSYKILSNVLKDGDSIKKK